MTTQSNRSYSLEDKGSYTDTSMVRMPKLRICNDAVSKKPYSIMKATRNRLYSETLTLNQVLKPYSEQLPTPTNIRKLYKLLLSVRRIPIRSYLGFFL